MKFRGSSFETLDDLEQRFRGNNLILENKTIANANPLSNVCKYFFVLYINFLQDTRSSLIYTEADDSKLA